MRALVTLFLLFNLTSVISLAQLNNCIEYQEHKTLKNNEEFPLRQRPIQGNLIVTEDRYETLQLVIKENLDVRRITAGVGYAYGQMEKLVLDQDTIRFNDEGKDGDKIAGDRIFTTNNIYMLYEDWIETYRMRKIILKVSFFDSKDSMIFYDDMLLPYIVINPDYLNSINDFKTNYLLPDSSLIHIGNAVYVDFEKAVHSYVDSTLFWPEMGGFDHQEKFEALYDSIWQETFFSRPGSGEFGLASLNSNIYSFPLNGGSGAYYDYSSKTGNTTFTTLFSHSIVVHELFHMFAPYFIDYMKGIPESPFFEVGSFAHNPVQFFGQSGFGLHYPLPTGYANLCPEHLNELVRTQEGYEITITESCNLDGLNLVNGDPSFVHSNFELFIMNLVDESRLDSIMYFGFNATQEDGEGFVTWKFDTLVSVTRDEMVWMKDLWYNRDNEIYKPYYDAAEKNMLIFFHGTGIPSYDELKTLHHVSDEIVSMQVSENVPYWRKQEYQKDIDHRYISYEQATLGLGKLTNNFPLPPGYSSCDTTIQTVYDTVAVYDTTFVTVYDTMLVSVTDTLFIDITTTSTENMQVETIVKIYPNPSNDVVYIEIEDYGNFSGYIIEIVNAGGSGVFDTHLNQNIFEIPVHEIGPPGTYFVHIQNEERETVVIKTLVLF